MFEAPTVPSRPPPPPPFYRGLVHPYRVQTSCPLTKSGHFNLPREEEFPVLLPGRLSDRLIVRGKRLMSANLVGYSGLPLSMIASRFPLPGRGRIVRTTYPLGPRKWHTYLILATLGTRLPNLGNAWHPGRPRHPNKIKQNI